jgi:hypothetical protein
MIMLILPQNSTIACSLIKNSVRLRALCTALQATSFQHSALSVEDILFRIMLDHTSIIPVLGPVWFRDFVTFYTAKEEKLITLLVTTYPCKQRVVNLKEGRASY